jgi:signal recognition particle receptor subunit beta
MQVVCIIVLVDNTDDNTVHGEQWVAVLAHGNGMRKVLAESEPQVQEWQAIGVLLQMLRREARWKLFEVRVWTK